MNDVIQPIKDLARRLAIELDLSAKELSITFNEHHETLGIYHLETTFATITSPGHYAITFINMDREQFANRFNFIVKTIRLKWNLD